MKRIFSLPAQPLSSPSCGTLTVAGHTFRIERGQAAADTPQLYPATAVVADEPQAVLHNGRAAQALLLRFTLARAAQLRPELHYLRSAVLLNPDRDSAAAELLHGLGAEVLLADAGLHALPLRLPRNRAALRRARLLAAVWPQRRATISPLVLRGLKRADLLVGEAAELQALPAEVLHNKTVLCLAPTADLLDQLHRAGCALVISPHAPLPDIDYLTPAEIEALSAALHHHGRQPSDAELLAFLAAADWEPAVVTLNPPPRPRFAFVIHPLKTAQIANHPHYRWTRLLPPRIVEWCAAFMPPLLISTIRGIRSAADGRETEGVLLTLGSTPREMMRRPPAATYRRLIAAAAIARRRGARLMGLGAFTSVVGDAGVTVAARVPIGITSGNSLTVAATLEGARQALTLLHGSPPLTVRPLVIGATGSIGSACARLLAQLYGRVMLVAPRPERLLLLKHQIEQETPEADVIIALSADDLLPEADLVITTTSALSGKVINVDRLKPAAVVCDVARPPDLTAADAARRPDVLCIESGEIQLPGTPDFGFDIDMPPGTAYACLAETALLAMEGLYDDYTLGRNIDPERVRHIDRLWRKHGLRLAPLRSFGTVVTDEHLAAVRRAAGLQLNTRLATAIEPAFAPAD